MIKLDTSSIIFNYIFDEYLLCFKMCNDKRTNISDFDYKRFRNKKNVNL